MYKIKFTPYRAALGKLFFRQSKDGGCVSLDGRYKFYIGEDVENPDFWVVQGKGVRKPETCNVAPENVIFLNTEPRSVLNYPTKYLKQFAVVSTSQYPTDHKGVVYGPPVLPWFVGYKETSGEYSYSLTYNDLKGCQFPKKEKLLSVISSNLAVSRGHLNRLKFVKKLKAHFGDQIDVFGRGFNGFDDKWDILSKYKYHICIENCSEPYYWTEKISDCFLAGTFPLYYGCKNFSDYFPAEAFRPIDIMDADKSIEIIENAIKENLYEKSQEYLYQCKDLVLDKYNMFEYIASLCDRLNPDAPKQAVTINPCKSSHDLRNFTNYLFMRSYYKMEMKIYNLFHK